MTAKNGKVRHTPYPLAGSQKDPTHAICGYDGCGAPILWDASVDSRRERPRGWRHKERRSPKPRPITPDAAPEVTAKVEPETDSRTSWAMLQVLGLILQETQLLRSDVQALRACWESAS